MHQCRSVAATPESPCTSPPAQSSRRTTSSTCPFIPSSRCCHIQLLPLRRSEHRGAVTACRRRTSSPPLLCHQPPPRCTPSHRLPHSGTSPASLTRTSIPLLPPHLLPNIIVVIIITLRLVPSLRCSPSAYMRHQAQCAQHALKKGGHLSQVTPGARHNGVWQSATCPFHVAAMH